MQHDCRDHDFHAIRTEVATAWIDTPCLSSPDKAAIDDRQNVGLFPSSSQWPNAIWSIQEISHEVPMKCCGDLCFGLYMASEAWKMAAKQPENVSGDAAIDRIAKVTLTA
jgi:hypothetical protein